MYNNTNEKNSCKFNANNIMNLLEKEEFLLLSVYIWKAKCTLLDDTEIVPCMKINVK